MIPVQSPDAAAPNMVWPPVAFDPVGYALRIWSAWFSADSEQLTWAYSNLAGDSNTARQFFRTTGEQTSAIPRQYLAGRLHSVERTFWGSVQSPGERRTKYHVPVAADIAGTSSALLFAKPPRLGSDDAGFSTYLEQFWDDTTHADFLEAAEVCAGLGGVFLKIAWDTTVSDRPWIESVHPDAAIPTFTGNKLTSVTFWRVIAQDGNSDMVVRHLETHTPGMAAITHGVYEGNADELGEPVPLTAYPETVALGDMLTDGNTITLPDMPAGASTVVYVPNMKPNRVWRQLGCEYAPLGRSDYQGITQLMDGLDEVYSSWMRDVRTAKSRLIVPHTYLDNIDKGQGAVFDEDREVWSPISLMTSKDTMQAQIMAQQFTIRWQEHQSTCLNLVEQIIGKAGYSGQTFGLTGDIAMTATEVEARERKSLLTRGRKILYWAPAIANLLFGYSAVDRAVFGTDVEPQRPDVEFQPVALPDEGALAQTAATLRGAGLLSLQTGIQMAHPDWTETEVDAEAARVYEETGLEVAARAKVSLAAPLGASLQSDIAGLADQTPAPPLPPVSNDDDAG